ncbi:hypothetical protein [Marinoscillum sp.]|uniref:hypothetical protein n=1 Tax=Marinoscillum sp. TaxID=2024838 RepID=UPI003BAB636D
MKTIFGIIIATIVFCDVNAQNNETINGVLTVNTSGANTLRVENDVAGEEAKIRFRSKALNNNFLHADIGVWATNSNQGFLGFKVPHSNSFGIGYDLVINHLGEVGIGTTNPSQQLHLTEKLKLNWNDANTVSTDDSPTIYASGQGSSYPFSGRGNLILQTRATNSNGFGDLVVMTGQTATPKFVVKALGDVGIGTTTPDSKLTVKGNIHAEEVKVDLNVPGPDYVFDEEYELASLDEINAYIKAHKHLPEVPSAKEMEANGINLSEMNMLLLKKVEELTLLLIEQNDRIKKLEANQNKN